MPSLRPPAPDDVETRMRRRTGFGASVVLEATLDMLTGYFGLRNLGPCVTVFGSARCLPDTPAYESARRIGRLLAESGLGVITGGGPGVMEAASRGAKEAGGFTLGCNIRLAPEQAPNPYLDRVLTFRHFFTRKAMLIQHSTALIVMPGGFGTLDEVFEAAVLVQKEKIRPTPLILVGEAFWRPLRSLLEDSLLESGAAGHEDLALFRFVDTPEQAIDLVLGHTAGRAPAYDRLRRGHVTHTAIAA
jgi:uncharacterized protein (TIGR00730 family)